MTTPLVRLRGVSKSFPTPGGATSVLEGVDLEIEAGQKLSLVGPSGSGKSTLLSLIAGLLPPDAGTVEFDGVPLNSLDDDERTVLRARQIGIGLQSENFIPFLTVLENVELALDLGGRRPARARAQELLNRMRVAHSLAMGTVTIAIFVFGLLLQRRREYVTLRAQGMLPRAIRAFIGAEAGTAAVVGCSIGVLVGLMMAYYFINVLSPLFVLKPLYVIPWTSLSAILGLVLGATLVTSVAASALVNQLQAMELLRDE